MLVIKMYRVLGVSGDFIKPTENKRTDKTFDTEINSKFCPNCGQPKSLKRIDRHYISKLLSLKKQHWVFFI